MSIPTFCIPTPVMVDCLALNRSRKRKEGIFVGKQGNSRGLRYLILYQQGVIQHVKPGRVTAQIG